ncbi:MAG: AbrB/MazE/SpoVT family DNA-binding domain-containing protein [Actinobacteria bacterium]|jgi:AbrB family looped-hinge helix DNA binding protein|nr:AbrB/MazE/SpoVT family DNA-binding domain-containing protein [Actinomycetota bacterium]MDA8183077.1 AbrB/MazE/SpoVT family DNA-binding domain-containing protein [Actinomycetota bacterium]
MRTTIDKAGRIVVPKQIRDRLHLSEGCLLDIEERDGAVELRPASVEIEVVETPQGPVAVPSEPLPALTDAIVQETVDHLRG